MKKIAIYSIILVMLGIGISASGCINSDSYVIWNAYCASYTEELNITAIRGYLVANNITILQEDDGITCAFGKKFNNISLDDTKCWLNPINNEDTPNVWVQFYDGDKKYNGRVDDEKKALEKSMEYIVNIIYNATGQYPSKKYFVQADGSPLRYDI